MITIVENVLIAIEDLKIGETFKYEDEYYVIIDAETNDNVNTIDGYVMCFCLADATVYRFYKKSRVEKIDIECIIKK